MIALFFALTQCKLQSKLQRGKDSTLPKPRVRKKKHRYEKTATNRKTQQYRQSKSRELPELKQGLELAQAI